MYIHTCALQGGSSRYICKYSSYSTWLFIILTSVYTERLLADIHNWMPSLENQEWWVKDLLWLANSPHSSSSTNS